MNGPLAISLCLPPGWGSWSGGATREAISAVERRAAVQLFSGEWFPFPTGGIENAPNDVQARVRSAIRMRINFAPEGLMFEGCTPSQASPVAALPLFCEDIYDISPTGEALFSPMGDLTAWKFLASTGRRTIDGTQHEAGQIYVKVVFPTPNRTVATQQIISMLSSLTVR